VLRFKRFAWGFANTRVALRQAILVVGTLFLGRQTVR
jgi:hypothetical protein